MTDDLSVFEVAEGGAGKDPLAAALLREAHWQARAERLEGAIEEVISNAARHSGCLYCGSAPGDGHSGFCPALVLRKALSSPRPESSRLLEVVRASALEVEGNDAWDGHQPTAWDEAAYQRDDELLDQARQSEKRLRDALGSSLAPVRSFRRS